MTERKPPKRSVMLRIKLSEVERSIVAAAAENARLTLSSYVRMVVIMQAEAQLHAAGKDIAQ